jgi:uncharacterized protein YjiS (DUF1127 family)
MNAPSTRRPTDTYRFEAAVRSAAWAWVAKVVAAAIARHRAHGTMRELNALTDRQLCDIGLRRAEIEDAAARSVSAR